MSLTNTDTQQDHNGGSVVTSLWLVLEYKKPLSTGPTAERSFGNTPEPSYGQPALNVGNKVQMAYRWI